MYPVDKNATYYYNTAEKQQRATTAKSDLMHGVRILYNFVMARENRSRSGGVPIADMLWRGLVAERQAVDGVGGVEFFQGHLQ